MFNYSHIRILILVLLFFFSINAYAQHGAEAAGEGVVIAILFLLLVSIIILANITVIFKYVKVLNVMGIVFSAIFLFFSIFFMIGHWGEIGFIILTILLSLSLTHLWKRRIKDNF